MLNLLKLTVVCTACLLAGLSSTASLAAGSSPDTSSVINVGGATSAVHVSNGNSDNGDGSPEDGDDQQQQ